MTLKEMFGIGGRPMTEDELAEERKDSRGRDTAVFACLAIASALCLAIYLMCHRP